MDLTNGLLPPQQIYDSAGKWFWQEGKKNSNNLFKEVFPENPIPFVSTKNIQYPVPEELKNRRTSPQSYCIKISEGRVWGTECAVSTPDNALLWDFSYMVNLNEKKDHPIFKHKQLPPALKTTKPMAVVYCEWPDNYYHWMFDVISRIQLLRESGMKFDKIIMKPFSSLPFQEETLNVLGIGKDDIIQTYDDFHLQSSELIVPSREQWVGHPSKWACDFLQRDLQKNRLIEATNGSRRIYISRANAYYRKIINEDEVLNLLQKYQFESVQLEDLSVYDQAKLFSSAEMIVAPHGAALTNLIFCPSTSKVLEIFPHDFTPYCFYVICCLKNLDYYYLLGKTVSESPNPRPNFMTDIIVDLLALENILRITCK